MSTRRRAAVLVLVAVSAFAWGMSGRPPSPPTHPTPIVCRRADFPAGTNPCPVP